MLYFRLAFYSGKTNEYGNRRRNQGRSEVERKHFAPAKKKPVQAQQANNISLNPHTEQSVLDA